MTRRERMERRAERRLEWAEGRKAKSAAAFSRAHGLTENIPFGQPILVGHHSEKRHRRVLEKADNAMRTGCESADMASHHASKAAGIERQLETSIFSDDDGAAEACEAKAAELDASAERKLAINKAWRKHAKTTATGPRSFGLDVLCLPALLDAWAALGVSDALASRMVANVLEFSWTRSKGPCDASHDRANARRYRERAKNIRAEAQRQAEAEAAPGGLTITRHPDYDVCAVRFAEKPDREILDALRAAGYRWGAGAWSGATSKLPAEVAALEVA